MVVAVDRPSTSMKKAAARGWGGWGVRRGESMRVENVCVCGGGGHTKCFSLLMQYATAPGVCYDSSAAGVTCLMCFQGGGHCAKQARCRALKGLAYSSLVHTGHSSHRVGAQWEGNTHRRYSSQSPRPPVQCPGQAGSHSAGRKQQHSA